MNFTFFVVSGCVGQPPAQYLEAESWLLLPDFWRHFLVFLLVLLKNWWLPLCPVFYLLHPLMVCVKIPCHIQCKSLRNFPSQADFSFAKSPEALSSTRKHLFVSKQLIILFTRKWQSSPSSLLVRIDYSVRSIPAYRQCVFYTTILVNYYPTWTYEPQSSIYLCRPLRPT